MKQISEYKYEDGYIDEKDCHYDDLESLLQSKILGYCGCGQPQDNLKLVYDMIKIHEKHNSIRTDNKNPFDINGTHAWDTRMYETKQYISDNWEKFYYFFWYVMDEKKITSHGSSIPGWVDDKNFVEALEQWHEEYIKDESNGN